MTTLPDWLVERAALDEVPAASRDRVAAADPDELARRIAGLQESNAAELASHPAGPAVAQIEGRIAAERRKRRNRRLAMFGALASATAAVVLVVTMKQQPASAPEVRVGSDGPEITRPKGPPRLHAYRQVGDQIEKLEDGTLVRSGDLIQLRYVAGNARYGVIASIDGAGAVTLHHPADEDAPPEATALASKQTALPHAYALDDAPRFERFFFVTADDPIDVGRTLDALRSLATRTDAASASAELPASLRQVTLRLRKPDRPTNPKSPNP